MSESAKIILNVGQYPNLLLARSMVLQHAGFSVIDETDLVKAVETASSESVSLVLFCHTIPSPALRDSIAEIERRSPSKPLAYVLSNELDKAPWSLDGVPSYGPDLIAAIRNLLGPPVAASGSVIA